MTVSPAADLWAYGVCVFVILAGTNLFPNLHLYQEICTTSKMPELLAETLTPVIEKRIYRHLKEPIAKSLLTCLSPHAQKRGKSVAVHKALAGILPGNGNN